MRYQPPPSVYRAPRQQPLNGASADFDPQAGTHEHRPAHSYDED